MSDDKMDLPKFYEIFNWLANKERYENGVTNNEVIEHFGINYIDVWNKLKSRKKAMFYENGRWYRWQ